MTIPAAFEAWIGGYVGPSYKVTLQGTRIIYEVFEQGYVLHNREELDPTPAQWRIFLRQIEEVGFWNWAAEYLDPSQPTGSEETTWSITLKLGFRELVSRGEGAYAPGFVAYLRAVRGLLEGRQFA
ncbi:MAG: hypothetical protein EA427_09450 [Spirochaetaceae bacterium]|nr:MAG: hypothetical protein EA427_09450 [Spirochaetaceae bacterium]